MGKAGVLALALVCVATGALAQVNGNAGPEIPDYLIECYRNQSIFHRENRLPQTLRSFLDLVRKVEGSASGRNLNAREIAASLQYFLRKDGIQPSPVSSLDPAVVSYAPSGQEYFRHRVVISSLVSRPNQQTYAFLKENLTTVEMCNLHFMLSYSVDGVRRNDENCGSFTQEAYNRRQYRSITLRSMRQRREEEPEVTKEEEEDKNAQTKEEEDKNAQVESLPPHVVTEMENSQYNETDKSSDFTIGNNHLLSGSYESPPMRSISKKAVGSSYYPGSPKLVNVERSGCPVENGVISTDFGTVAIGTVVAGITAGLQRSSINPANLAVPIDSLRQDLKNIKVDNVWGSTLAGVLSDVIQGVGSLDDYTQAIGLKGGWNNTVTPKWYLLASDQPNYATDGELRGALDGLWLGQNVNQIINGNDKIKLSNLIDMYYSNQGILGMGIQACNRRSSFNDYAQNPDFSQQLEIFATVMQKQGISTATIVDFQSIVANVINRVNSYVPTFDSGTVCAKDNADQSSNPKDYSINLAVVIDNSWPVGALKDILTVLIDEEVVATPYTSNTTIICGGDGRVLLQVNDASTFNSNFTNDLLNTCAQGLDIMQSLYSVEVMFRQQYQQEQATGKGIPSAFAVLLLPTSSNNLKNSSGVWDKRNMFNVSLPDVTFIVATNSQKDAFNNLVSNANTDSFVIRAPISGDQSSIDSIKAVATRLQDIPQRISNPYCGSYYEDENELNKGTLQDNVRVGYTKFYRVQPNYFYSQTNTPKISIRSSVSTTLTVCVSRTDPNPVGTPATGTGIGTDRNQPRQPAYPTQPPVQDPQYRYNSNNGYNGYSGNNGYNNRYPQVSANRPRTSAWSSPYMYSSRQASSDANCITVNSASAIIPLPEDPCDDYSLIYLCPPIYISVYAPLTTSMPPSTCQNCRLPTNAEYTMDLENLTCDSGAGQLLLNPVAILLATAMLLAAKFF